LTFIQSSQMMILDAVAVRNLELVKNLRTGQVNESLLGVIDYTLTSPGGAIAKKLVITSAA